MFDITEDINLNLCIFGFQDESHNNIDENKMRIYYPLGTKNIRYKTRERITSSIMGFQAVNGQSVAYFPKRSVTYYFLQFLLRVRIANTDNPHTVTKIIAIINDNYHSEESVLEELKRRNQKEHLNEFVENYISYMKITKDKKPTHKQIERKLNSYKKKINVKNKVTIRNMRAMRLASLINSDKELKNSLKEIIPIIMILDNCKIHKSHITLGVSKSLNIDLRFLPKYSPQFNPIEQVWRSIKREISYHIIKTKKQLQKTIYKAYMNIINNKSYFKNWLEKYTKHKYQI